jgi:hypothetical protein
VGNDGQPAVDARDAGTADSLKGDDHGHPHAGQQPPSYIVLHLRRADPNSGGGGGLSPGYGPDHDHSGKDAACGDLIGVAFHPAVATCALFDFGRGRTCRTCESGSPDRER